MSRITTLNKKHRWLLVLFLFIILAAIFHFSSPNIPEPDSFYYARLGEIYQTRGIFNTDFPWLPHSVIKNLSSSLWYGFGIFMVPFSYSSNLVLGIKIAGLFLTTLALFLYYIVIKRHQIKMPLLWPLLLFFSAPNILFSFLMTRPQLISFGLGVLLFSFLITGGFWSIFLTSFGIVWFHMNFAWLPFLLLGAVMLVKLFTERKIELYKILGALGGALMGWLLRPQAINAAKLFYVQIFKLIFEKQGGLPLLFGSENLPLSSITLFKNFSPFLLLWVGAIAFLIWFITKKLEIDSAVQKTFIWSSLFLSGGFFFLTMVVARKAYGLWVAFGLLFIAAAFSYLLPKLSFRMRKNARVLSAGLLITILIFTLFYSSAKNSVSMTENAYKPDHLKEIALWLKENSQAGDIVFNLSWDHFSPLFFWNQNNYYIGGLDPIFQHDYNPSLYWKFHYLSIDEVTKKTCGAIACTREMLESTYEVLTKDFNAKYITLTKQRNPAVYYFLENDPRFEKQFETAKEAVYLIKSDAPF